MNIMHCMNRSHSLSPCSIKKVKYNLENVKIQNVLHSEMLGVIIDSLFCSFHNCNLKISTSRRWLSKNFGLDEETLMETYKEIVRSMVNTAAPERDTEKTNILRLRNTTQFLLETIL